MSEPEGKKEQSVGEEKWLEAEAAVGRQQLQLQPQPWVKARASTTAAVCLPVMLYLNGRPEAFSPW